MVKIVSELDLFIVRLEGIGGKVQKKDDHVVVQGLKLGTERGCQFLYLAGNTVNLTEKDIFAEQKDGEIHLYNQNRI